MSRRVRVVLVLLVMGLLAGPSLWAQGTVEELLAAVPEDAAATVVIRSFTQFEQDVAVLANQIVPGQGMMVPVLLRQQMLGADGGLALQKSVGVVLLSLPDGGTEAGVLLPMVSYADFSNALQMFGYSKTIEDDLDAYIAEGGFAGPTTHYVAGGGSYRFWTQSKSAALAYHTKFETQAPTLAGSLSSAVVDVLKASDVSVYSPMAQLTPRVQSFTAAMMAQMQAMTPTQDMSEMQAAQMELGQKVLFIELDALGTVLAQLEAGLLTLDMTPEGLTLRAHLHARPDTTAARFFQAQSSEDTSLLGQVPADGWLAVSGNVDMTVLLPALKDLTKQMMEAMAPGDEELRRRQESLLEAMDIQTGELAMAMLPPGEGGEFLSAVYLYNVTDSAKALEQFNDGLAMWQGSPAGSMMGGGIIDMSQAEIAPVETYRGVEISQVRIPITVPEEMPMPGAELITSIYGEELVYQYGAVGNTIVTALGSQANQVIKKAIDGLKDGATGIVQTPGYQSAVAGLPRNRCATGYFSLIRLAKFGLDMVQGIAPPGEMPDIDLDALPGIIPSGVGSALTFTGNKAQLDVHVPQAELANLGALVQQIMMAAMGEMQQPGAPGPMPPMQ